LREIDLGPDATLRNIAQTEAAARRLETGEVKEMEGARRRKPRLGKDGKPWRLRKRRNSDDLKRDELVEAVLKEGNLGLYKAPEPQLQLTGQAADDFMAEQFQREYFETVQNNHIKRAPPGPPGSGKGDDRPKGPKLGGSRSARAAMRAQEEAAAKKKKKR